MIGQMEKKNSIKRSHAKPDTEQTTPPMNPEHWALYDRIKAFRFDDQDSAFPFAVRLARDNGWSIGFALRAITEYRKFAFLAAAAGHPVSPSDQVWHLHILYTQSYWNRFCKNVLRVPLHHGPTKGGSNERRKFDDWYKRTLESYESFFGSPPEDIWPPPNIRFGIDLHFRRVNTKRYWVVPRVGMKRMLAAAIVVATAAFITWGL